MTNIALIALGDHALQSHLKPLLTIPHVNLIGTFDPSDDSFARAKAEYNVDLYRYSSDKEIFADKNVDAVFIGSPDRFHFTQMRYAIENGKHVFCEKPLCDNQAEFEELESVLNYASRKKVIVTSCHPRRFDEPYVWLKENVIDLTAKYGNPLEMALDFTYHAPDPSKIHLHGGSMLKDHANHEIDYLHAVLGHVNFNATKLLDEHDRYHIAGIRDDGVVFNFRGTRRLDSRVYAEKIYLRFDRAEVLIDAHNKDNSYIDDHETGLRTRIEPGVTNYDTRFKKINSNWINAINGAEQNYLDNKDLMVNSYMSIAFADKNSLRYEF